MSVVGRMLYVLPVMLLATAAFAGNTVDFDGSVQVSTCDIRVNGGENAPVILLPEVSIDTVRNNLFSVPTTFVISVHNCPVAPANGDFIYVYFLSPSDGEEVTMANTGTATGVGFAIRHHAWGNAVHNLAGRIANVKPIVVPPGATSGSAEYVVGYRQKSYTYAEGNNPPLRPGTVRSVMQYAIEYY